MKRQDVQVGDEEMNRTEDRPGYRNSSRMERDICMNRRGGKSYRRIKI